MSAYFAPSRIWSRSRTFIIDRMHQKKPHRHISYHMFFSRKFSLKNVDHLTKMGNIIKKQVHKMYFLTKWRVRGQSGATLESCRQNTTNRQHVKQSVQRHTKLAIVTRGSSSTIPAVNALSAPSRSLHSLVRGLKDIISNSGTRNRERMQDEISEPPGCSWSHHFSLGLLMNKFCSTQTHPSANTNTGLNIDTI